ESWGVKVTNVEIKQVDLDPSMVRAIARQAEAERLRRAKIINAEGEQQAAEKLVEAAEILATSPGAMQLRYLGTLSEIASERSSTIVFPFPLDMMQAFRAIAGAASPQAPAENQSIFRLTGNNRRGGAVRSGGSRPGRPWLGVQPSQQGVGRLR